MIMRNFLKISGFWNLISALLFALLLSSSNFLLCSGQCTVTRLINGPSFGTISSTNFPGYYVYGENCGWIITVNQNNFIQLDLAVYSIQIDWHNAQLFIYDGPTSSYPKLFGVSPFSAYQYRISLVTSNNTAYIKFTYPNSNSGSTGFQLTFKEMKLDAPHSFVNSNYSAWQVSLPYGSPVLQPNGKIRLVESTPSQNGKMWATTALTTPDNFAIRAKVTIGSNGTNGEGFGFFFVPSSSIALVQTASTYFGIDWTKFAGLAVFFRPSQNSIFATYSQNMSNNPNASDCSSNGTIRKYCNMFASLRTTFDIIVVVSGGSSVSVTLCLGGSIYCEAAVGASYDIVNALSTVASQPLHFGMAAYNSATNYDYVDVTYINFMKPVNSVCISSNCPPNAYCLTNGTCTCLSGWSGSRCQTPICTVCWGGGTCIAPQLCMCTPGNNSPNCQSRQNIGTKYVNTTAAGVIMSDIYPYNYFYQSNCDWTVTVAQGSLIQITLTTGSLNPNGYDQLNIYDGTSSQDPLLYQYMGATSFQITLLTTSNTVYITFKSYPYYYGAVQIYYGFLISYRQVDFHPEWSFYNTSAAGWNVSLPYVGQPVQPDGTVRLVQATANQNGVMWNLTPFTISDFVVSIVVRTGTTGTKGGGIAAMFANSALMTNGFVQGSFSYGVNWTSFAGLVIKAAPMYKALYAMYSQNITSLGNPSCAAANFHSACNSITVYKNQFNVLISIIGAAQFWGSVCSNNTAIKCVPGFGNVYLNAQFTGVPSPIYFGIGASNSPSSFDFVNIVEAKVYTPNVTCPQTCMNGVCITGGTCTCFYMWTGTICDIPQCSSNCMNGAVCVAASPYSGSHYCSCTPGWYGAACNGPYCNFNSSLNATSPGVFSSFGYPSTYQNNERCGWWITAGVGYGIQLTMTVSTIAAGDYIAVYDGSASNSSLLFQSQASYYKLQITSASNQMFVWYSTDASLVGTGFNASYQQVPTTGVAFGYIQNFYYPIPTSVNQTDTWFLYAANGSQFACELQTYDLSNGSTVVSVYDGVNVTKDTLIAQVSINNYRQAFVTNGNSLLVRYNNLNGTQISIRLKFQQQTVMTPCFTGSLFSATSAGAIQSVNYGTSYYNRNETCSWTVTAASGYAISMNLTAGLMGPYGDFLYIYDGFDTTGLLLMKTYASYYKAFFTSVSDSVYVVFASNNDYFVGTGFQLSFQQVPLPSAVSGVIQSLNWGSGSYFNNENEGWQVNLPSQYVLNVTLTTTSFDGADYIDLFNGATNASTLMKRSYGGMTQWNNITNNSSLFVTFITNSDKTGSSISGFQISYSVFDVPCSPSCMNGGTCAGWNVCSCPTGWTGTLCTIPYCVSNTTISGMNSGNVQNDHDFLGNYFKNERCGWFITVSAGSAIQLNITGGTMDSGNDFLYIYDGETTLMATISASYYFASFTTASNNVFIYFVSNGNAIVGSGFNIDFQQVVSTGKICGSIQNVNYSSGYYENNENEQWLISVPSGNSLWFTLETPQNAFGDCIDALWLFDGPSASSPLITKWCYSLGYQMFATSSSQALIQFTTDSSGVGHGFLLEFSEGIAIPRCSQMSTIVNQKSGFVTSPQYSSGFYNNNENCYWKIVVPTGYSLWLEVSVLVLGAGDSVFVYDGSVESSGTQLVNTSTSYFTGGFLTSSSSALIVFYSDADLNVGNGFQVYFRQAVYSPMYSFNNADFSAWDVLLPYSSNPLTLPNGAIRLVDNVANTNGAMWATSMFKATDFVVNIAITIGNSGTGGDGFGIFFVNNMTLVQPPGVAALGVDWTNFAGLAVRESPASSSTFLTFSASFSSAPRNDCPYSDNFPKNCGTSTHLTQSFILTIAVTNSSEITVINCFPNSGYSPLCNVVLWKSILPSSLASIPEPLLFGIGASNVASYNYVDIESVNFYTRAYCANACQNNGTCISQNVCYCPNGWAGSVCEIPICSNLCLNGGSCTEPEHCSCSNGWNGTTCELPICNSQCENGGNCTNPDTCTCTNSWSGHVCNIPVCSPSCGMGGYCSSPNNCTCEEGWFGLLCDIANCTMPCFNNGTCSLPETCACVVGWTGSSCERLSGNITEADLLAMTDNMLAANAQTVGNAITKISDNAAATADVEIIIGAVTTIDSLLGRFANITSQGYFSAKGFQEISKVCASAADKMLYSVTNYTDSESAITLVETTIKCEINDGSAVAAVAEPTPSKSSQRATKEQLRKMFSSFMKMLVSMFAQLRNILPPGTNMTFSGQFYGAVVFNMRFGDLPGLTLQTGQADATFQKVGHPSDLIASLPSGCSPLTSDSTVPIVLSSFIVNVNDVDVPFNMPTIAVRLYCQEQLELSLNPLIPMLVVGIPSVHKAFLFDSQKRDAQCDVSQKFCNADNVATMGSLASFPLTISAGDFVLIFPVISYNYTVRISFNTPPTRNSFHWLANVTRDAVTLYENISSVVAPRVHYNLGVDLRIIIPGSTLYQMAKGLGLQNSPVTLFVHLKRNFTGFNIANSDLRSACELQRCYGYHLRIGLAANSSVHTKSPATRKKRTTSDSTQNSFELEPESNESAVVFKSSYFGDFGADLVISPNTIQFSDIFANFATLVAENSPVLAFQVTAVVFFLIGVVFAFKFDRTDLREWAYLPIVSNQSFQKVNYLISVNCMRVRNFNLVPQFFIRLVGNINDTSWRLLDDGIRPRVFDGKHPANFILTTQLPLGRVDAIELKLETKITGPKKLKMQLDRVSVVEVDRGLKHIFVVNSPLQSGDAIRVTLASEDELKGYTYLLTGHSRTSFTDIHPWLSVVQRPLPSNWTRTERLACVVSALFLAMLVNAMFYGKESSAPTVGVILGPFKLSWFTVWTSFVGCVIAIPPTAIIAFIFKKVKRKSAVESEWATVFNLKIKEKQDLQPLEQSDSKTKKKPLELPYYCVIIAWFLVAASVGSSAFFVVMYSLSWGEAKSLQWLSGMVLACFQDILLIQPVKVLIMAILSATIHHLPDDGLDLGKLTYNINNNRRKVELFFKLRRIIVDAIHHVVYVTIFAAVIATMTNPCSFTQIKSLRPIVMLPGVQQIQDTVSHTAIFNWLQFLLIPNFLTGNQVEYGGHYSTASSLYQIWNPNVVLLGPIRLRQQRVSLASCRINQTLGRLMNGKFAPYLGSTKCQEDFSNTLGVGGSSEKRAFNGSWLSLVSSTGAAIDLNNMSLSQSPWIYRETDGAPYAGWEAVYFTGGYYVDLPRRLSSALSIVETLRASRWLDNATTVLFVDFNLFNAQCNLFIPVRIVFESLSAGGMTYHVRMFPLQLYQYSGASSTLIYIVQAIWVVILVSLLVQVVRRIKKEGFANFRKNGWNWLDLCQVLLGLGVVVTFAARIYFIITKLTQIQTMRTTYANLDLLTNWEDVMFDVLGVEFFLTLLLFFRHLTMNKQWAVLVGTFSKGKWNLVNYSVLLGSATILFAGIAFLIMGHTTWNFSSYSRAISSLVQSLIGTVDYSSIAKNNFYLFIAMFYNTAVIFVGGYVFATLLISAHGEVAANAEKQTSWDAELAAYMTEGIRDLIKFKNKATHVTFLTNKSDQSTAPFTAEHTFKPIGEKSCAEMERSIERLAGYTERLMNEEPLQRVGKIMARKYFWLDSFMEFRKTENLKPETRRFSKSPLINDLQSPSVITRKGMTDFPNKPSTVGGLLVNHVRDSYGSSASTNVDSQLKPISEADEMRM